MLRLNIILTIRQLLKNKKHIFVNLFGLISGLTAVILMLLYISYESSYDSFNSNYERLFRVERTSVSKFQKRAWDTTPFELSDELKNSFPEIVNATSIKPISKYLSVENETFFEETGYFSKSNFLQLFTFDFVQGNSNTALEKPMSIVLSESLAKKLFGDGNVIGKILHVDKKHDCIVTGVFSDYQENSHLRINYLISFNSFETFKNIKATRGWNKNHTITYVLLNSNAKANELSKKIKYFLSSHFTFDEGFKELLKLRPIGDIYMKTPGVANSAIDGNRNDISVIYLFMAVLFFTALITALNYISLTTFDYMSREFEIGIKKVMGISKGQLRLQFITESLLIIVISFIIAVVLSLLILPIFNSLVSKNIVITFADDWFIFVSILLVTLFVGIITSMYAVFYLSSLKISSFLQGIFSIKRKKVARKVLVVFQLVVAMPLILTTILIIEQINYLENRDIGFDKENLLVAWVQTPNDQDKSQLEVLKNTLLKNPNVLEYSISNSAPFVSSGKKRVNWEGGEVDEKIRLRSHYIDYDFIKTYGMTLVKGRGFSKNYTTDMQDACIINESALRMFGWENAIGKTIDDGNLKVIGVIKDFNDSSLFVKIPPMILQMDQGIGNRSLVTIRVSPNKRSETKRLINNLFNNNFSETTVNFKFMDASFDATYLKVLNDVMRIFILFSVLAIMLAILGLYNLASYSLKIQKKMIAIRKVVGASVKSIFFLLLKEYMILFGIAVVVSLVSSYFLLSSLMNIFPYHVEVKFIYLLVAALLSLFAVLISISSRILSTIKENPIKAISSD